MISAWLLNRVSSLVFSPEASSGLAPNTITRNICLSAASADFNGLFCDDRNRARIERPGPGNERGLSALRRILLFIHSPSYSAGKNYIGNAAEDGQLAVVFAQLEVNGQKHGVHAFLVPIRGENGDPLPGVTIEDNGLKMGLNGVDNGQIWFDHVEVPRTKC